MPKKIAIAFFGIPRSTKDCAPSISKNVINSLLDTGADVKAFYHLFDIDHVLNIRSNEDHSLYDSNYDYFNQFDGELEAPGYCLKKWNFKEVKKYGDTWSDGYQSLSNLIHQLHSLNKVTQRVSDYNPDLVAFVRPDLLYHDKINRWEVDHCINFPNSVILPNWHWSGGYNDRFALCGRSSYRAYGERILNISQYHQNFDTPLHAEKFLKYSLDKANCEVLPVKFRGSRVRTSGRVEPESFNIITSLRSAGSIPNKLNLISKSISSKLKQMRAGYANK